MKTRPALSTAGKVTVIALVVVAGGIWIQALSGAPEYSGSAVPPGPIVLVLVAGAIALATRWWWTPMGGALLSGLILFGAFVTPGTAARLGHPGAVGAFVGTVIQMLGLVLGVAAGVAATVRNYEAERRRRGGWVAWRDPARTGCKGLGVVFVLVGVLMMVRGVGDPYHNLLHLATGVVALCFGFAASPSGASGFCLGFGVFYLGLGAFGLVVGDPALDRLVHLGPMHLTTGDHLFHVVLGLGLLAAGLLSRHRARHAEASAPGSGSSLPLRPPT